MIQSVQQNGQRKLKHTYQRNGIYYLCLRVPSIVRDFTELPQFIRFSLRTRSHKQAHQTVQYVVAQMGLLKAKCMSKKAAGTIELGLITHMTIEGERSWDFSAYGVKGIDREIEESERFRQNNPELYDPLKLAQLEAIKAGNQPLSEESAQAPLKLSEAVRDWLAWLDKQKDPKTKQVGMSEKVREEKVRALLMLVHIIGDKLVGNVVKTEIRDAVDVLANMPKGNVKPFSAMNIGERVVVAKEDDIDEEQIISSKMMSNIIKIWKSFFANYLQDHLQALTNLPTAGLKTHFESISYGSLGEFRAEKIRDYLLMQPHSDYRWLALMGLYTGARRGELYHLTPSSFRVDEETGRHYIFIDGGKTKAARRTVPVHSSLIDAGLISYVEQARASGGADTKVFASFKKLSNVTGYFRECLNALDIPEFNEETKGRKKFSFHSLRSTFITNAMSKNAQVLVQQVVGHEHSQAGSSASYIGEYSIKQLAPVVDSLDW